MAGAIAAREPGRRNREKRSIHGTLIRASSRTRADRAWLRRGHRAQAPSAGVSPQRAVRRKVVTILWDPHKDDVPARADVETMREVGGAAGVAGVATVLVAGSGIDGFHTAFVIIAVLAVLGLVAAVAGFARGPRRIEL
jgi:hypothetical protein